MRSRVRLRMGGAARSRRVVGIDSSARQLETARRLADEHEVELTLHHGIAERTPQPDDAFDVAVSEYGAVLWAEPVAFLTEARRLLRDGGRLSFPTVHPLVASVTGPRSGGRPSRDLAVVVDAEPRLPPGSSSASRQSWLTAC